MPIRRLIGVVAWAGLMSPGQAGATDGSRLAPLDVLTGRPIVIDGDTLDLGGRRVRIIGYDAPEMKGDARGPRARAALDDLVRGEIIACRVEGQDKYRRTLATCGIQRDGRDLTTEMLRAGQGTHFRHFTLGRPEAGIWDAAEREARAAGRGIWSAAAPASASSASHWPVVLPWLRDWQALLGGLLGAVLSGAFAVGILWREVKGRQAEAARRRRSRALAAVHHLEMLIFELERDAAVLADGVPRAVRELWRDLEFFDGPEIDAVQALIRQSMGLGSVGLANGVADGARPAERSKSLGGTVAGVLRAAKDCRDLLARNHGIDPWPSTFSQAARALDGD